MRIISKISRAAVVIYRCTIVESTINNIVYYIVNCGKAAARRISPVIESYAGNR